MARLISQGTRVEGVDAIEHDMVGVEVFLANIQENEVPINPGIVGCGVLLSNLSQESKTAVRALSESLVSIYEGTFFDQVPGDLDCDFVKFT